MNSIIKEIATPSTINSLTIALCLLSFFAIIANGGGSHGNMGMFAYADSYVMYFFAYMAMSMVAVLQYIYARCYSNTGFRKTLSLVLIFGLFIIGIWMVRASHQHFFVEKRMRIDFMFTSFPMYAIILLEACVLAIEAKKKIA